VDLRLWTVWIFSEKIQSASKIHPEPRILFSTRLIEAEMAKSRRINARRNRSRKAERKNRKSRKSRRVGGGLVGYVYGPVHQAIGAMENATGIVANTASGIVKKGLRGVNSIGLTLTSRTNKAVSNLVTRRKSRKNRRANRK
jgi:hypothetical protein